MKALADYDRRKKEEERQKHKGGEEEAKEKERRAATTTTTTSLPPSTSRRQQRKANRKPQQPEAREAELLAPYLGKLDVAKAGLTNTRTQITGINQHLQQISSRAQDQASRV